VLVLDFRVRARVIVKFRARVRDSWGTKRLGTNRLKYEMSVSRDFEAYLLNLKRFNGPPCSG